MRLRIFISPTSVGLGYGRHDLKHRGFSWKHGIDHFSLRRDLVVTSQLSRTDLPMQHTYTLKPGQPTPG